MVALPRFLVRMFRKTNHPNQTNQLFGALKKLGFVPHHIVDIGGNRGDWSRSALDIFPAAHITIFEPQKNLSTYHGDLAAQPNVKIVYAGVGDTDGVASFTLHDRDDSCSFSYSASDAKEQGYAQEEIEIVRLDSQISESQFGKPDVVKIDAEGFDLQVIEGAQDAISKADVVLVEASVSNPQYPNTLLKVLQKMDALGYRLWDITDLNRTPEYRVLWLVEVVFVRKGGALDIAGSVYK